LAMVCCGFCLGSAGCPCVEIAAWRAAFCIWVAEATLEGQRGVGAELEGPAW